MDILYRYQNIPASKIAVDGYQRLLEDPWVAKIVDTWDDRVYVAPKVAHHPGETPEYLCIDGQHTVAAFRRKCVLDGLDPDVETITVDVVDANTSQSEEASLFLKANRGRRPVVAFDQYRAAVLAGEVWAINIKDVVDDLSLKVVRRVSPNEDTIAGVSCMKTIVINGSPALLKETLAMVMSVWDSSMERRFDPFMTEGLALLIRDLQRSGNWTTRVQRRFTQRLKAQNPASIKNEAMDESGARAGKGMQNPHVWALGFAHAIFGSTVPVKVSTTWGARP